MSVPFTRKRPKLTAARKRELDALFAMPDDQIDFSDIPEITAFNGPVYVNLFAPPQRKKSVTIRLDGDVVKWFKGQGKGWQTKMNWVLRLYYASHRKTGAKVGRP
ncbi:MAG TPA: BrnA antitoxin family protein [Rhizomicrobium sp.]|nr:BrnA antitoxin family protein [Rhizomicrobium sp.]